MNEIDAIIDSSVLLAYKSGDPHAKNLIFRAIEQEVRLGISTYSLFLIWGSQHFDRKSEIAFTSLIDYLTPIELDLPNALNSGNLFRESNIHFAENVHNVDTDNSIDIVKTIENFFVQNAYYKLTKPIITCSPDMYYEFSDLIEPKDF